MSSWRKVGNTNSLPVNSKTSVVVVVVGLSGAAGSRKSPSLLGPSAVRGPRSEELPLAIPELPVERELKLDESPTTPSSTSSQLSKATLTRQ